MRLRYYDTINRSHTFHILFTGLHLKGSDTVFRLGTDVRRRYQYFTHYFIKNKFSKYSKQSKCGS